ncbi:hypothetical protein CHUAL_012776 [Chamberlinius hualienensis]
MAKLAVAAIIISLMVLINADRSFHTSVEAIKRALKIDKEIAQLLKNVVPNGFEEEIVINRQVKHATFIKKYIDEHNKLAKAHKWKSNSITDEEAEAVAGNPIFAFQIMRRLSVDYEAFPKRIKEIDLQKFNQSLENAARGMSNIGNNIIQLQQTHRNFPSKDLRRGRFGRKQTSARLTVGDCMNLSLLAKQTDAVEISLQWSLAAHELCEFKAKKVKTDGVDGKSICDKSTKPFYEVTKQHLNINDAGGVTDDRNSLCSRTLLHKQTITGPNRRLHCSYLQPKNEPYVTIKNYKLEILSVNPTIVTIHDVITSNEANHIIKESITALNSPQFEKFNENNTKLLADGIWLNDHHDKVIERISKRITEITGLSTSGSEKKDIQVINYGLVDVIHKEEDLERIWGNTRSPENNVATLILYLSDVEIGGSTYFPKIGLAIQPKIGSATLIFNDEERKQTNKTSIYGGCPVILGNKWG